MLIHKNFKFGKKILVVDNAKLEKLENETKIEMIKTHNRSDKIKSKKNLIKLNQNFQLLYII